MTTTREELLNRLQRWCNGPASPLPRARATELTRAAEGWETEVHRFTLEHDEGDETGRRNAHRATEVWRSEGVVAAHWARVQADRTGWR